MREEAGSGDAGGGGPGGASRDADGGAAAGAEGGPEPSGPAGGTDGDLLGEAVDRMAHQIKNPLQAVAMNLEVIRSRVAGRAPELWAELERYGDAVDQNVTLLDRRLRLLLQLGRRSPDAARESVDVPGLVRDFAGALRLDEDRPRVRLDAEAPQLAARARPGYVLALLMDLWRTLRTEAPAAEELPLTVTDADGRIVLTARLSPSASAAAEAGRDRWTSAAEDAGGRLEVEGEGDRHRVRLVLPTG